MKKVIITGLMLVVLASFAMASDVTLGGDITYGVVIGTATDPWNVGEVKAATVDVKAAVDDYVNSVVALTAGSGIALLEDAWVKVNLGNMFMMDSGIGWTLTAGYESIADNSFVSTTALGKENVANAAVGSAWIMGTDIDLMGFLTIRFAVQPANTNDFFVGAFTKQTFGDISVNAEVMFDAAGQAEIGDGNLIVDGEFKMNIGDIKLDLGAGMRMSMMTDGDLAYGVGLGVDYGTLFGIAAGFDGNSTNALNFVNIDLTIDPVDLLDIRAGVLLSLADGAEMFQGADMCIILNVGKADIYLGYLVSTAGTGQGEIWADAYALDADGLKVGGPYIKVDLDY
jgi:hypothetical protein